MVIFFSANFTQITTADWIKKTTERAVLPWLLALVVFTGYLKFVGFYRLNTANLIIEAITKPYYHLWFIPAWIGYQAMIRWFEKKQTPPAHLLTIAGIITAVSAWLQISGQSYLDTQGTPIVAEIFYIFRPQFFLFFALGYAVKHHNPSVPKFFKNTLNNTLHFGLAATLFIGLFFSSRVGILFPEITKISLNLFVFLYLNLSLFAVALPFLQADELPKSLLLNWVGKQSLLIYLWHPLAIVFARYTISYRPSPEFYFSSITSTFTILVLIYFYDRYRHP